MQKISQLVHRVVSEVFGVEVDPELTRPDAEHGDYATNIALRLARQLNTNPRTLAEKLAVQLRLSLAKQVQEVGVAGPGFINLKLSDDYLINELSSVTVVEQSLKGQVAVAEYGDPNPFKVLHAGHLYTSIVGNAVANLLEAAGAKVHRINYGGDVGLHVGKTMWGITKQLKGLHPEKLEAIAENERADWLASCYVKGSSAYETDDTAKQEIIELNKHVYRLHAQNDHETAFAHIYWTCRQWSYDYFSEFYKQIGIEYEKVYPESEVAQLGIDTVKTQLTKGIFEESDGAVVFKGEPYGLHTRVFINSQGLPTYEAKDIGLIMTKKRDYNFDISVVITGNEQAQYMAVVLKALEQFEPDLVKATHHLTHGLVKLKGGVKMSSREGNIIRAVDIIEAATVAQQQTKQVANQSVTLGAVKYALLKSRIGGDIIYDPVESVSIEGNSGPYLQYAYARACSILAKADQPTEGSPRDLQSAERSLANKLTEYREAVERSISEFMPHHICTYLYELAQTFNRFYEQNRVIGDEREATRLKLVKRYADVIRAGLNLLGIEAPEKM